MVEIALCLAVIGFALVAIIGVLPTGMTVQRDNREETIINQDATYWMTAIRNGEKGLNDLTNYVERIIVPAPDDTNVVTEYVLGNPANPPAGKLAFANGHDIIGLLTGFRRGYDYGILADVFSISGPVIEKEFNNRELGFKYRLTVRITEFGTTSPDYDYAHAFLVRTNLWSVQLIFDWPLKGSSASGNAPPRRQSFRALVQGDIVQSPDNPFDPNIRFFED